MVETEHARSAMVEKMWTSLYKDNSCSDSRLTCIICSKGKVQLALFSQPCLFACLEHDYLPSLLCYSIFRPEPHFWLGTCARTSWMTLWSSASTLSRPRSPSNCRFCRCYSTSDTAMHIYINTIYHLSLYINIYIYTSGGVVAQCLANNFEYFLH